MGEEKMRAKLQIDLTSNKQLKKICKAEKLLKEAGIDFDKETNTERHIREWVFNRIDGATLIVGEDEKLSTLLRIQSLRHKIDDGEVIDMDKIKEIGEEINRLEKKLELH